MSQQLDGILDQDEMHRILEMCYMDTRAYCRVFYPDIFFRPFSSLHNAIFAPIDAKNDDGTPMYNKIVIKAPRGLGKTSIVKALIRKRIRYKDTHFVTYIGKNEGFAIMQTENIKNAMLQNKIENKFFGAINAKIEDVSLEFSKKSWITSNGIYVLPRGAGQAVRGITFDYDSTTYRPDLIVIDDLEDDDEILSEINRSKLRNWFLSAVVEARPQIGKMWQIIYIDTLKHEDSLLAHLLGRGDWHAVNLSLCNEDYQSLAPDFVTTEEILAEVEEHRKQGTLDIFAREKMGRPTAKETANFKRSYFKYYQENSSEFMAASMTTSFYNIVIADPAKTAQFSSADSAIVVWGVDLKSGTLYFRYEKSGKMHPDEFVSAFFDIGAQFGAYFYAMEETGLNEFIRYPVHNEAVKRGVSLERVVWLSARTGKSYGRADMSGKAARVAQLVPYYRQGRVRHNKEMSDKLEGQLLSFPRPALWDVCDAAAYVVEVLESYSAYFEEAYLDEGEDEYADLQKGDEEEMELENWRIA